MDFHQAISSKQWIFREQRYNKVITRERELPKTFNKHLYSNIVEKTSGIKPKFLSQPDKNQNIQKILEKLSNPTKTILVYCKYKTSAHLHFI